MFYRIRILDMFNNQNSNLFSNPYLPNNGPKSPTAGDIANLYQKLDTLKAQQNVIQQMENATSNKTTVNDSTPRKTAFTEISELWAELSNEERKFIESSSEYIDANIEYQNAFNSFLLDKLGDEFLRSKFGAAPEKVLLAIKHKKEEYQTNLSNDISTIKTQNQFLMQKNDELAKSNEEMTKLIKSLQDQLWVNK